jgi:RsiW-degrading membrane proteinase PrsW (M82 family)
MLLGFVLSVFISVVTTGLYVTLVWWLDRHEKEPLGLAAAAFLWGAVPAIVVSLIAELLLDVPLVALGEGLTYEMVSSSLVAPIVEEVIKAIALLGIFYFWRHEFDNVLDGIIYGSLVGFGFAMMEDLFYSLSSLSESGWGSWGMVLFLRTILFGLNHAFFTALTGIGLGYARLARERWKRWLAPLVGLGAAVTFHAIHNLGASLAEVSCLAILFSFVADWGGVLVVVVIALVATRQEKQCIVVELRDEIPAGILSNREYRAASSYRQRLAIRWRALQAGNWRAWRQWGRLFHLLTELAFKKHQYRTLGDERGNVAIIVRLRRDIVALRREMGLIATSAFCTHCGASLLPNDTFCRQCRQPVQR